MLVMLLLFAALLFVAAVYLVRIYNGLIALRENSEGEYAGVGGRVHQGHPIEAAPVAPIPSLPAAGAPS